MDPNEAKGRLKDYKNVGKDPEVCKFYQQHKIMTHIIK
jgi:hypothetical protein